MDAYCSACGALLPTRPPVRCPSCGREHWRNAKPGAAVLVTRDRKLLLVRRALTPWLGSWCAPAGFCGEAEHPIAAAEREAFEETGMRVRITGFLGIWLCAYADQPADEADIVSVAYYHAVPADGGAPSEPDRAEVAELGWFAADGFPVDLAPPEVLPAVLDAWSAAASAGETVTPLRDRPPHAL